jgi:hypothetical protein
VERGGLRVDLVAVCVGVDGGDARAGRRVERNHVLGEVAVRGVGEQRVDSGGVAGGVREPVGDSVVVEEEQRPRPWQVVEVDDLQVVGMLGGVKGGDDCVAAGAVMTGPWGVATAAPPTDAARSGGPSRAQIRGSRDVRRFSRWRRG